MGYDLWLFGYAPQLNGVHRSSMGYTLQLMGYTHSSMGYDP